MHPIGQPSVELPDGNWEGMTPIGLQQAIGQMYNNAGIVPGNRSALSVKGTTGWSYSIPASVAFVWTSYAARRAVLVPIAPETLPVAAPVGGAKRTDVIYVGTDGIVRIAQGATSAPAGTVVLDRMVIPASAANTQSATSNWDVVYAIPAGAALGRMIGWEDPGGPERGAEKLRYTKRFVVPTDRIIRMDLTSAVRASGGTGGEGRMAFRARIDGTWTRAMSVVYNNYWNTWTANWSTEVSAGAHVIELLTEGYDSNEWEFAVGGEGRTEFSLWDAGATV